MHHYSAAVLEVVAIALGSNLGDRAGHIARACLALQGIGVVSGLRVSGVYETEPVAVMPGAPVLGGAYLNAVAVGVAADGIGPDAMLGALMDIERSLGRDRAGQAHGHPRTIDLDLLLVGEQVVRTPGLTLPHPRLGERLFVLEPLGELIPEHSVPVWGRSVRELRALARAAALPGSVRVFVPPIPGRSGEVRSSP